MNKSKVARFFMADGVLAIAIVSICHNLVLIQAQVLVVE